MEKKISVCLIAQFPPPIHGLSKAVQMLWDSKLNGKFNFEKINITNNFGFIQNLIRVIVSKSDIFYLTISSSKWGNLRDLFLLGIVLLKRKKIVLHLHGSYYREMIEKDISKLQKFLNYYIVKKVSAVIVLSESLKYIFEGMIEDEKIYVVPNCVDDQFNPNEDTIEKKIETDKKTKRVLYLSNFIKSKGYRSVLELALLEKKDQYKCKNNVFIFEFAGKFYDEIERKYFFDFIKNNNLEDIVMYKGIVTGDNKKKILLESDIFVLLTNYPKEGQPISILEAMANGMYVVTTNHAGIPDFIQNYENGLIVDKNNINETDIYKKIKFLKKDEQCRIALNNYRSVQKKFRISLYITNIENIFKSIINN